MKFLKGISNIRKKKNHSLRGRETHKVPMSELYSVIIPSNPNPSDLVSARYSRIDIIYDIFKSSKINRLELDLLCAFK